MKIHTYPWTCEACGQTEPSGASMQMVTRTFRGGGLIHKDPRVCAEVLEQKKAQLDRREAALNAQDFPRNDSESP